MSKRKKIYILSTLLIFFSFSFYLFSFSDLVGWQFNKTPSSKLRFREKKIELGKEKISYFESGKGETIFFIHGFLGEKRFWIPYMKKLLKKYKVVAIDLPGHGKSSLDSSHPLDIYSFANELKRFLEAKKISKVHLVGHSMGGAIATIFCHQNPSLVKSLTLLSPLGVKCNDKSLLQKEIKNNKNPLFPRTIEEFDHLIFLLRGEPLSIPYFEKWIILQKIKRRQPFFQKIFENFYKTPTLEPILPSLKLPSFLIYGKEDKILPIESFVKFYTLLSSERFKIIEHGEHVLCKKDVEEIVPEIDFFISTHR